jgi:hypothetical protein
MAALLTTASVGDAEVLAHLLAQVDDPIAQVSADGAYDTQGAYAAMAERGAQAAIAPRQNARAAPPGHATAGQQRRNETLQAIEQTGREAWKQASGYHQRSLAENVIFRLKRLFGARLSARDFHRQDTEAYIRCAALNRMTFLGMPDSYAVVGQGCSMLIGARPRSERHGRYSGHCHRSPS